MADQDKLLSTVEGVTPEAFAQLQSETEAASADAKIEQTEIESSLSEFLESLEASGVIDTNSTLSQLSATEPAVAAFVAELQQAIFDAKAATTQGILLAEQLAAGSITKAQFKTAVEAITITTAQLKLATAIQLPGATQKLLLALASSNKLNQLVKLTASAASKASSSINKLNANSLTKAPVNAKIQSEFKDEKLSFLQNLFKVAANIALQNVKASASSLLSLNPQPRIMTGARAVIRLNNKVAALCNNIQYEVSTDWQEIRGIDELLPNDLAPSSYSVKGSMSIYRVPNRSPVSQFLQQDMFRGMIWPLATIEIRDKRTDELIMLVKRAAITSRSEAFTKNQLTSTNLSFVGIGFRDEEVPELLPDELVGSDDGTGGLLDTFKAISNKLS